MIGEKMQQHPDLVEKVLAAGHQVIGNHSWSHPNFHDISPVEQIVEVVKAEDAAKDTQNPKLFRYPYGNSSCETNVYLHAHGYRIVGWHVDSCDWAYDKAGEVDVKEALSCEVLPQFRKDFVGHVVSAVRAHNGGIILMHEIHPNTLKKLDDIITAILADGFIFSNIDDPDFQSSLR
jgi:peptidoglycan/xylan/chitin deacetylase (PgdA/CDA1 family)